MSRKFYAIFTALLLSLPFFAQAQNLIFYQNTQSQAFLFKYGGGGPSAPLVDFFIKKISEGNGKALNRTEYVLVHEDVVRLTKVDATHFDVQVNLGGFRLSGDVQYRGFDVSQSLTPNAVKFRLEHRDKFGKVKQGWDFNNVNLAGDPAVIANFRATDTSANFLTDVVLVTDKQFQYGDAARLGFESRVNLIDGYYRDAPALDGISQELNLMDPGKFEQLEAQEAELKRLETKVLNVRNANYSQNLPLTAAQDPAGFLGKMNALETLLADKKARLADTRARLHEFYHARGLSLLQAQKPVPARADFQKAIELNPVYAPSHIELARILYNEGKPADAVNKLQHVFNDLQMDAPVREKARTLTAIIYQNHVGNANYASQKADFDKALVELAAAKNVCTRIPAVPCDQTLENGLKTAHTGIFQRKLAVATKLEGEKKWADAEKAGADALVYQQSNPAYVADAQPAIQLLKRVRQARYDALISEADAKLKANLLQDAEKIAREAVVLQATHPADVPDKLPAFKVLTRVMAARYSESIRVGKAKYGERAYLEALVSYESAKAMEAEYPFVADTTLGTQIRRTAKEIVLLDGAKGLDLAKGNRLPEAREVARKFNEMVDRYRLAGELAVANLKQELQAAIFSQECTNATQEFNNLAALGNLKKAQKQFLEADVEWGKALAVANQFSACQINIADVVAARVEHALPVKYQSLLVKTSDAVTNTNYSGAIATYIEAGNLFYSENLAGKFGMLHAPLLNYVQASGNQEFFLAAAGHFIETQEPDAALFLVYSLATKGYSLKRLKGIQAKLGKALAIRDKQANPGADPKQKALDYTKGNKSMAGVAKAYKKQWKAG